eukprot:CAMPEP_0117599048 /NCGR_PEP_ID=MMETSP0784-20121206/75732_1 /TAXON_ID=39447 /ORGANISM="" /LENGTH=171 /DNA_ID=CAMNT_0005401559 /DNA_START=295 /DNA_END=808 /DNA_ORIENTATION=-
MILIATETTKIGCTRHPYNIRNKLHNKMLKPNKNTTAKKNNTLGQRATILLDEDLARIVVEDTLRKSTTAIENTVTGSAIEGMKRIPSVSAKANTAELAEAMKNEAAPTNNDSQQFFGAANFAMSVHRVATSKSLGIETGSFFLEGELMSERCHGGVLITIAPTAVASREL